MPIQAVITTLYDSYYHLATLSKLPCPVVLKYFEEILNDVAYQLERWHQLRAALLI